MLKISKNYISLVIPKHPILFNYLASERSERDTYRGNTIENQGCLFIYICLEVRMSFCTLTFSYFLFDPVPNFTKRNPPV